MQNEPAAVVQQLAFSNAKGTFLLLRCRQHLGQGPHPLHHLRAAGHAARLPWPGTRASAGLNVTKFDWHWLLFYRISSSSHC